MVDKENALGSGFMTISPPAKLGGCSLSHARRPARCRLLCLVPRSARRPRPQSRTTDLQEPLHTFGRTADPPAAELLVAPHERKAPPAMPEEATLMLKKFAETPWVVFGDVTPGASSTSSLHLVNPGNTEVHLTLEHFPAVKGESRPLPSSDAHILENPALLINGHDMLHVPQASQWKVL